MDPEVCEMIRRGNTAAFIFSTMTLRYKNHDMKKNILPSIKQIQSRVKALKKIEKSRNSLETNMQQHHLQKSSIFFYINYLRRVLFLV